MFAFATPFRATLILFALASTLVSANPSSHEHNKLEVGRRHHALNLVERDAHLEKRFDNARFTLFDAGVNACGGFDQPNDFIVALNTHQWDGGKHCFEDITISYNGKTQKAKITDMVRLHCHRRYPNPKALPGPRLGLGVPDDDNFSRGLFIHMVPGGVDQGVAYGSWHYGVEEEEEPKPAPPPKPKTTTSTKHRPSATTTKEKPTTTSSKASSKTSTKPSTKISTSTTSSSTTSAPTATVTSFAPGNLNEFNVAFLQLVGLAMATSTDA
ncbi:hypothetical protein C8Q76DRAFT_785950 [Earliella scabrosa]|nr:hypothetical protein C8Q76DRAFT_785950 [Earliella scabrosa]